MEMELLWSLLYLPSKLEHFCIFLFADDGAGVEIWVLDTGVRATHNDFGGRAKQEEDFVNKNWWGVRSVLHTEHWTPSYTEHCFEQHMACSKFSLLIHV